MATKNEYNGWFNYETWLVKLWMDNEQGSYNYYCELAQQAYDDAEADASFTREERAALNLSDLLKDNYEEAAQDLLEGAKQTASIWADLLGAALSEVNWHEIASHMIEDDVDKEAATEDA